MLSVFDLLVMHPAVGDLPTGWLRRLAPLGRPVFHGAGHRLFREGERADRFWLVHAGEVAIDLHVPGRGDVVVEQLGAGSVIGWSWLLAPYLWRFGAVVADEIRAVEFGAAGVRAVIGEDPDLGRELEHRFMGVVADRLQATRHRLIDLYAYPAGTGNGDE
jgi:CRP/FNR family transcriptional regulator, cyclic AMP receptor protein